MISSSSVFKTCSVGYVAKLVILGMGIVATEFICQNWQKFHRHKCTQTCGLCSSLVFTVRQLLQKHFSSLGDLQIGSF